MISMHQRLYHIAFIALVGFSAPAFAINAPNTATKPNQNTEDKPIIVSAKSTTFTFKLKSNPSTGYSWFLMNYDHKLLKPISQQYVSAKNNVPGASGYSEWTFKANDEAFQVPQVTPIILQYMRPWENKTAKPKVVTVVFRGN